MARAKEFAKLNRPQKFSVRHRNRCKVCGRSRVLKYGRDRQSAIDGVRRVSRPGRRVYVRHDRIPRVYSGLGISILSTSHGLMSDREARRQKLGGELLCEVW
jgi:ribosomal protein S8